MRIWSSGGNMRTCAGITEFVDIETYPLLREGTAAWVRCVDRIRHELGEIDSSVLSGFIRSGQLARLAVEGKVIAPLAWSHAETVNAYNVAFDANLPERHPGRIRLE